MVTVQSRVASSDHPIGLICTTADMHSHPIRGRDLKYQHGGVVVKGIVNEQKPDSFTA